MKFYNVSSPFRTAGSDTDLELHSGTLFTLLSHVLPAKRVGVIRLALADVELFIIDPSAHDPITGMIHTNLATMNGWNWFTSVQYLANKRRISHLSGNSRKMAKSALAGQFGLADVWSMTLA
jgi:hypothetical protein